MQALNTGNNETLTRGAAKQSDGTWIAMTYTQSKVFKTESGAAKWLAKRGYNMDGSKL